MEYFSLVIIIAGKISASEAESMLGMLERYGEM
jgi:hypothetical protein